MSLGAQQLVDPFERRVALVIGNSNYQHFTNTPNAKNDAEDLTAALQELGYEVISILDGTRLEMEEAVREFDSMVRTGDRANTAAVVFYAGHGIQDSGGVNYLIPVNADIRRPIELPDKALSANYIMATLDSTRPGFSLLILDACRDNPIEGFRSATRGLSIIPQLPPQNAVWYSAEAGQVALDGDGRNSPFAEALLEQIRLPGIEFRDAFKNIRRAVREKTGGSQLPNEQVSFDGDFFFASPEALARRAEELESARDELQNEIQRLSRLQQETANAAERRRLDEELRRAQAEEEARARAEEILRRERERLDAERQAQEEEQARLAALAGAQTDLDTGEVQRLRREYERLRAQAAESDLVTALERMGAINAALASFDREVEGNWEDLADEINELFDQRVERARAQPRDPFENTAEYQRRIDADVDEIEEEREETLDSRRAEFDAEIARQRSTDAQQRAEARAELQRSLYSIPSSLVSVEVGRFDTWSKVFPITVASQDDRLSFSFELEYEVPSATREQLRDGYYQVVNTAAAQGYVAEVGLRATPLVGELWMVWAAQVRVRDIVEGRILTGTGETFPIAVVDTSDGNLEWNAGAILWVGSGQETLDRGRMSREESNNVRFVQPGWLVVEEPDEATGWPVNFSDGRQTQHPVRLDRGLTFLWSRFEEGIQGLTQEGAILFHQLPEGATVRVSGRAWTPVRDAGSDNPQATLRGIDPGTHELEIQHPDWGSFVARPTVRVLANSTTLIDLGLGTVRMSGLPAGAEVLLGGRSIGRAGTNGRVDLMALPAGYHEFTVQGSFMSPQIVDVILNPGEVRTVSVNVSQTGRLRVSAPDGVQYRIAGAGGDGRTGWISGGDTFSLEPGDYLVSARRTGDSESTFQDIIEVRPRRDEQIEIPELEYSVGYRIAEVQQSRARAQARLDAALEVTRGATTPGWLSLGVGLAGAGAALAGYFLGEEAMVNYNAATTTADAQRYRTEVDTFRTMLNVGVYAGSAGISLGLILLATAPNAAQEQQEVNEWDRQIRELENEGSR